MDVSGSAGTRGYAGVLGVAFCDAGDAVDLAVGLPNGGFVGGGGVPLFLADLNNGNASVWLVLIPNRVGFQQNSSVSERPS
jgi:hypothetical protein